MLSIDRKLVAIVVSCAVASLAGGTAVTAAPAAQEAKAPLSGEAAKKSEPGKAVVALITAARAKDKAAMRKLLLPEVVKDIDGPNGALAMEMVATMADPAISELTIEMVSPDHATGRVTKRDGASSESTGMTIKRVDGAWKISL
jgi:hypothetical protein